MLPAYVYGALEPEQMLACQSYLRDMADQNLLLQYRDLEETATQRELNKIPIWLWRLTSRDAASCQHDEATSRRSE